MIEYDVSLVKKLEVYANGARDAEWELLNRHLDEVWQSDKPGSTKRKLQDLK